VSADVVSAESLKQVGNRWGEKELGKRRNKSRCALVRTFCYAQKLENATKRRDTWGRIHQNAAWQLLNQLGDKVLLGFPFVPCRRDAGFDYPDI
jgi:hypothetical protein